jgi:hypothetical protein
MLILFSIFGTVIIIRAKTQTEYKRMHRKSSDLLSERSITCPAYNAREKTGMNSDNPTIPIEKELLVR